MKFSKLFFFSFFLFFLVGTISALAVDVGYNGDSTFNGVDINPSLPINYSISGVNDSLYWNGNLWSDTRWLNIDGSNANQNIIVYPYNITASWFNGLFNWTEISDYLSFNGNTLDFNESKLNETSDIYNDSMKNYVDSQDIIYNISMKNYVDSINNSQATWVDTFFIRFTEIVSYVGNWSADKLNYYTKTEVDTNITSANTSMKNYVDGTFITQVTDIWVNESGDTMTGNLDMGDNNINNINSINITNNTYLHNICSSDGNSIYVRPTCDEDDFFTFKTPAHRPTIKREGGKFIYFESSNVYDVGISFRKNNDYSGTLNYEKDTLKMTLLGKNSPVAIKTNSEYNNYFLFETYNHQPQISVFNGTILKINDSLEVIGNGNFTGTIYSNEQEVLTSYTETDPYWSGNQSSYSTTAEILAFGYYNSSDFVITDYFTKSDILGFNYYNLTDFDIADYFTSAEVLAFNYYNLTDFDITNYFTSAEILGFNYYNSTDFVITDYYTKIQIDNFNYYNATDFDINDYYPLNNPYGYYNSTNPQTELDPHWSANYTAYNDSWSLDTNTWNTSTEIWNVCSNGTFLESEVDPHWSGNESSYLPLIDNSMADTLHRHSELSASDGSPDAEVKVGADGNVMVGGGVAAPIQMHVHSTDASESGTVTPNGGLSVGNLVTAPIILTAGTSSSTSPYHSWIQARNYESTTTYNLVLNPSGGNVGVGTDKPSTFLDVEGTANVLGDSRRVAELSDDTSYASGVGAGISFGGKFNSAGDLTRFSGIWGEKEDGVSGNYGGQLHLGTRVNGGSISSDLVIDSAGDVGIGENVPVHKLSVKSSATTTWASSIKNVGTAYASHGLFVGTSQDSADVYSFGVYDYENTQYNFVVKGNGNVGVKTNLPTEVLDINGDAIRIRTAQTPASSSATCTQGMIAWDTNYVYVCTATNTWKRASLGLW